MGNGVKCAADPAEKDLSIQCVPPTKTARPKNFQRNSLAKLTG